MADLSRLSEIEARVLLLIGEGHTAKSAARELGVSENAVNERLRSARRKTGAGSSRELARRLRGSRGAAQDACDEEIGLEAGSEPPAVTAPDGGGQDAPLQARRRAMILSALAAAGAAGLVAVGASVLPPPAPHVVATSPADGARVAAGVLQLSVTFDRPMRDAWSFTTADPASFPCSHVAVRSADRRTFTLPCMLAPHSRYRIGFNSRTFHGFAAVRGGAPATPSAIGFSTD